MLTLTPPASHGRTVPVAHLGAPRGPRGLWGALAKASTPKVVARALPVSDVSRLGCRSVAMFDYDPALATSLGDELDPSVLLD